MMQRMVDEFDKACKRRKLKMSLVKSKGVASESAKEQINDFAKLYEELEKKAQQSVGCGWGRRGGGD